MTSLNRQRSLFFGGKFAQNNFKQSSMPDKIRSLRKSKGLSQEMLAESAGINLRTLQRIETGNAVPRGETLRLIAKALEVTIEELSESVNEVKETEDKGFLKLMNLSALSFWVIPFGNILIPFVFFVLWIYCKNSIVGAKDLGKRIIYFQIIWSLIVYVPMFIMLFGKPSTYAWLPRFEIIGILGFLFYILNSIVILFTTLQITRGQKNVYLFG